MTKILFGPKSMLRRVTALLLVLILALSLVGCRKKEAKNQDKKDETPTQTPAAAVEETPEPTPTPTYASVMIGTVTGVSTFLNVRSGPGTNYESIGKAYAGDEFTVLLKFVDGGYWHKIEYGDQEGYVHSDYLEVRSELVEIEPDEVYGP